MLLVNETLLEGLVVGWALGACFCCLLYELLGWSRTLAEIHAMYRENPCVFSEASPRGEREDQQVAQGVGLLVYLPRRLPPKRSPKPLA